MRLIAASAVSVLLLAAQTDRPAAQTVTAVRHWSLSDVTRVAIEVSGEFDFVTDRLHNPERVYFDILHSKPRIEARGDLNTPIDDPLLKRIRVAQTLPGVTRVVLDLGGHVVTTTSQLTNPDRLIIELRTGTGPIPTEAPPAASTPAPTPVSAPTLPTAKPERRRIDPPPMAAVPKVVPRIADPPKVDAPRAEQPKTKLTFLLPEAPPAKPVVPTKVEARTETAPPVPGEFGRAAHRTATGQTSLVRALGLKVGRVVIDAGHGGHDEGTRGAHGLVEKELVLDVAKRVGQLVEDRLGAEVVYTRTDDTFVPLEGRTALANEKKADLFLSIHANSSAIKTIEGVETYYLNFTESKDSMEVAARENASSQKSIFELRDIIQKITLHDKAEESKEFASRVQAALYGFSSRNFPGNKNRGVKRAPFVVLIGASMPSILAEIGFLTNPKEEAMLKRPDYRQRLAEALYRGVSKYAEGLSHFQIAQAKD